MTEMSDNRQHYLDAYQTLQPQLPGQNLPWLKQLRAEALTKFSDTGFPSPRQEEWRYTNVAAIEKKLFSPAEPIEPAAEDLAGVKAMLLEDVYKLVLVDGFINTALSELHDLPEGVLIMSMSEALADHPELVKKYIGQALQKEDHGFIHFNTAWFTEGIFVFVPDQVEMPKPLQLVHWVNQPDVMATTRNLVAVGASAQLQLIQSFAGVENNAYLTAAVNEFFVDDQAQLTVYHDQYESSKAYHFLGTYCQQSLASILNHFSYALGGLLARHEVHVDLKQAAQCHLNGLYVGVGKQHLDNHTRINHLAPDGISRENYKGIMDQRARGVFQGRVVVHEDAQKTDSEMNNRNLLLSEQAEADTKPQLEIYADDVKCAHGVTVGQLDEKSIFYLASRGLDTETARNMLTFAFANEVVEKIKFKPFRDQVFQQFLTHFPQAVVIKEWL